MQHTFKKQANSRWKRGGPCFGNVFGTKEGKEGGRKKYYFPRAAVTEFQNLGGLPNDSRGQRWDIRRQQSPAVPDGSRGEASLAPSTQQSLAFLGLQPRHCKHSVVLSVWYMSSSHHKCLDLCPSFLLCKNSSHMG